MSTQQIDRVSKMIEKCGITARDLYDLPTSAITFPDGAHYRMEVSGIEALSEMEALIDEMRKRDVPIHKVIAMGKGATLLSQKELKDLAQMGHEAKIEIIIIPGPRPAWDVGSHVRTEWGRFSGWRIRGSDNLSYLVADIQRCIDAGLKGFLLYGEDVLFLLNQMKENGDLPQNITFKISYTAGHANAAGAKLLEDLGAGSFNPVTDLSLPMLAGLRKAIKIPMDIVIVAAQSLGSFNRIWQSAEIARVCSPCYFKQELGGGVEGAREKVKFCEIMQELIEKINPELKLSEQGPADLAIP